MWFQHTCTLEEIAVQKYKYQSYERRLQKKHRLFYFLIGTFAAGSIAVILSVKNLDTWKTVNIVISVVFLIVAVIVC
jgi:hypothetical protein